MFEVTLYGLKCPFLFRFRLIFDLKKKKKQSQTTSNIIKPTLARPQAGIKP